MLFASCGVVVIVVSRLVRHKGHPELLAAMRDLDAELWVVGERLPVSGAGFKHLQVKKPGFQTWETWIEVGGARAVLTAELAAALLKETP